MSAMAIPSSAAELGSHSSMGLSSPSNTSMSSDSTQSQARLMSALNARANAARRNATGSGAARSVLSLRPAVSAT